VLEIRIFEGQSAPLSALATELVDLQVDLICTGDSAAAHAARKVTGTMPIVGASLGPRSNPASLPVSRTPVAK
jgi:hypothetical protein